MNPLPYTNMAMRNTKRNASFIRRLIQVDCSISLRCTHTTHALGVVERQKIIECGQYEIENFKMYIN